MNTVLLFTGFVDKKIIFKPVSGKSRGIKYYLQHPSLFYILIASMVQQKYIDSLF